MHHDIISFINSHHCLSATIVDDKNELYSFNAFYCYEQQQNILIFKSNPNTYHNRHLHPNTNIISGTIHGLELDIPLIKGIQYKGTLEVSQSEENETLYYQKFPFGKNVSGILFTITLQYVKYTSNQPNFGTKIIWEK